MDKFFLILYEEFNDIHICPFPSQFLYMLEIHRLNILHFFQYNFQSINYHTHLKLLWKNKYKNFP